MWTSQSALAEGAPLRAARHIYVVLSWRLSGRAVVSGRLMF
jgi:hypothetical protein